MASLWISAASVPKEVKWYDTDHAFNIAAFRDRADFIQRQIGISPIDPTWIQGRATLLPQSDRDRYAAYQTLRAAQKHAQSQ